VTIDQIVIGIGGIIVAVLIYFAGVQRGKAQRSLDACEARINRVVDNFASLDPVHRGLDLAEFIRAGAADLRDNPEVVEAARRIVNRGAHHPIPARIRKQIPEDEWLCFLGWCSKNRKPALSDLRNEQETDKFIAKYREREDA